MDEVDMAQQIQADDIRAALASRPVMAGESLTVCEECGEAIPAARRKAAPGCRLCIHCKKSIERGSR